MGGTEGSAGVVFVMEAVHLVHIGVRSLVLHSSLGDSEWHCHSCCHSSGQPTAEEGLQLVELPPLVPFCSKSQMPLTRLSGGASTQGGCLFSGESDRIWVEMPSAIGELQSRR